MVKSTGEILLKQLQGQILNKFKQGKKIPLVDVNSICDEESIPFESAKIPDKIFIDNCAKISEFLLDDKKVFKQLEKLNTILSKKIKTDSDKTNVNILRCTLEEELGKLGFHPHFGITLGIVSPETFRATVAHGLLLKDASIGETMHAEFTHILQWLAIAWEQEETNFLGKPAIAIFKQFGEEQSVFFRQIELIEYEDDENEIDNSEPEKKSVNYKIVEQNAWDLVFDLFNPADFRSPNALNIAILESTNKNLACLKLFLKTRLEKRILSFDDFQKKYSQVSFAAIGTFFPRKDNKINYIKGELVGVLEPSDIKIDLAAFKQAV